MKDNKELEKRMIADYWGEMGAKLAICVMAIVAFILALFFVTSGVYGLFMLVKYIFFA